MNRSSAGRVIAVVTVAVVALLGAFLLGRTSAPDTSAAAGPDCSKSDRFQIDVPAKFKNAQGTAYFSECEHNAAIVEFGQQATRVKIYASQTGSEVLAWWYPDCGMPEGVFSVGTPHPAKCANVGTVTTSIAKP
jgi:hypothetical protein